MEASRSLQSLLQQDDLKCCDGLALMSPSTPAEHHHDNTIVEALCHLRILAWGEKLKCRDGLALIDHGAPHTLHPEEP